MTQHLPRAPRAPHSPNRVQAGYQPKWEDGREVGIGWRDCAGRFRAIKDYLTQNTNLHYKPTVLDLGAYTGYFCRRLHEDFDAQCTAVDNNPSLEESPGVKVIPHLLNPDEIRGLGHFDVTLCLSVIHHHANWYDYLAALLESADLIFIETAHPDERMSNHHRPYVIGAHRELEKIGKVIAETAPMYGNQLRPLWVVDRRRVITKEEEVAILAQGLQVAFTHPQNLGFGQVSAERIDTTAQILLSYLEHTGWSLTYDPTVVASRLTQVMQQPPPETIPTPIRPPEKFEREATK